MQFQVKGQEYFLAFVEDEKRWCLFAPTEQGITRVPVYVDGAKYERLGIMEHITNKLSS